MQLQPTTTTVRYIYLYRMREISTFEEGDKKAILLGVPFQMGGLILSKIFIVTMLGYLNLDRRFYAVTQDILSGVSTYNPD